MKRLLLCSSLLVLVSCAAAPAPPLSTASPQLQLAVHRIDAPSAQGLTMRALPAAVDSGVSTIKSQPFPWSQVPIALTLPFVMAALVGVRTTSADKDTPFVSQTVRQQLNALISSFNYFLMNGVASSTVATQPVCARATTASKVKTTNATVLKESGLAVALAGSDNFWTLTGANLAAGFFRRYLLLDTAGVASVLSSTDALTKAACAWPNLPADGTSIVGILTIQNVTNPFIPATTLLSAAGVTDTYIDGYDDSVFLHAQVTP